MRLILEDTNKDIHSRDIIIETLNDDLTLIDLMDNLIKPVLLAKGYHPDNIKEYFNYDNN